MSKIYKFRGNYEFALFINFLQNLCKFFNAKVRKNDYDEPVGQKHSQLQTSPLNLTIIHQAGKIIDEEKYNQKMKKKNQTLFRESRKNNNNAKKDHSSACLNLKTDDTKVKHLLCFTKILTVSNEIEQLNALLCILNLDVVLT